MPISSAFTRCTIGLVTIYIVEDYSHPVLQDQKCMFNVWVYEKHSINHRKTWYKNKRRKQVK
jgi:hypothetical protein